MQDCNGFMFGRRNFFDVHYINSVVKFRKFAIIHL